MARIKTRSIKVSDELWDRVTKHADMHGISTAEYIRQAMLSKLGRDRKAAAMIALGRRRLRAA